MLLLTVSARASASASAARGGNKRAYLAKKHSVWNPYLRITSVSKPDGTAAPDPGAGRNTLVAVARVSGRAWAIAVPSAVTSAGESEANLRELR